MANTDLTVYRGDSKTYNITITNTDGTVFPISGYTVFMTVKSDIDGADSSAEIAKIVTNHTDAANGKTSIVLTSVDTGSLSPGKPYFYDMQMVSGSTVVTTLVSGRFHVLRDITQDTS